MEAEITESSQDQLCGQAVGLTLKDTAKVIPFFVKVILLILPIKRMRKMHKMK